MHDKTSRSRDERSPEGETAKSNPTTSSLAEKELRREVRLRLDDERGGEFDLRQEKEGFDSKAVAVGAASS